MVLSALGAGESIATANWFLRTFVIGGLLKLPFLDHDVQERLTRESGLEFVIARPSRLTDGKAKGTYTRTTQLVPVPSAISRADVADFLVESCTSNTFLGQAELPTQEVAEAPGTGEAGEHPGEPAGEAEHQGLPEELHQHVARRRAHREPHAAPLRAQRHAFARHGRLPSALVCPGCSSFTSTAPSRRRSLELHDPTVVAGEGCRDFSAWPLSGGGQLASVDLQTAARWISIRPPPKSVEGR